MLAAMAQSHPIRRFLGNRNVVTLLAMGGLVVSIGAFATVIGIGEVQIASAQGGSSDCWRNSWFVVGILAGTLGLLLLALAVSSNGSQSNARRRFPDLRIAVMDVGGSASNGKTTSHSLQLRTTNHEADRNASVEFLLRWEAPGNEPILTFFPMPSEPWTLTPRTTRQNTLTFPINHEVDQSKTPSVEVVDHISGRRVSVPAMAGVHHQSTWQAL